jgi:protein phosphatase
MDNRHMHLLARAVGIDPEIGADIVQAGCEPGDLFVLCSDGMSNHVDGDELPMLATRYGADELSRACVDLALSRGGKDNVTVVVVEVPLHDGQRGGPQHNGYR